MEDHLAAEICLRDAWPSPETADCHGWQLHARAGGYNRVNSVWTGEPRRRARRAALYAGLGYRGLGGYHYRYKAD